MNYDNLKSYRDHINSKYSASTCAAYYSKIRNVISFAKSEGFDIEQLDKALSQLDVLKINGKIKKAAKIVLTKNEWNTIYSNANTLQKAMLLVGLNFALHMDEVCDLQWKDLDLIKNTYYAERSKTNVVRAATIWAETLNAINALPKLKSKYVFVSKFGTRYNRNTKTNDFREYFDKLGMQHITFEAMKDSAFTAAWTKEGIEGRLTQMMAGHVTGNDNDAAYLGINPAIVRPACDAVHGHYFPTA
jgi:integrase